MRTITKGIDFSHKQNLSNLAACNPINYCGKGKFMAGTSKEVNICGKVFPRQRRNYRTYTEGGFMIESIDREGTKTIININTGLNVEKPVLGFYCECQYEYIAELLKNQLCEQFDELKKNIAKQLHLYLDPEQISELKSKLVHEWNGSKHCWK